MNKIKTKASTHKVNHWKINRAKIVNLPVTMLMKTQAAEVRANKI